ncbi:CotY/CotZ family spore coat protein [Bacillus sp. es.034]|uniref:CotY/CotZ family spore coat protein n=1 Tax=Bacillus sp. es.034 TaxID=1761763 RepID=UPI000BF87B39|nr:CotY/CotZ family spore coat protein [Bacillus sp. es.034]PFG06617.1 spore coat protein Z [Bacillus sp. es.034]
MSYSQKSNAQDTYFHEDYQRNKCHDSRSRHYDHCVEDVLEAILEAQKKAKKDHGCETSCKKSIEDLLCEKKKHKKNTIPFILYCGCEPFKGTGVTTYHCHSKKKKNFKCIETYVFKLIDLDHRCATLELLTFKSDHHKGDSQHHHESKCSLSSPCKQIDHKSVDDLMGTGICITVDLSCFCAITCLPAVHL